MSRYICEIDYEDLMNILTENKDNITRLFISIDPNNTGPLTDRLAKFIYILPLEEFMILIAEEDVEIDEELRSLRDYIDQIYNILNSEKINKEELLKILDDMKQLTIIKNMIESNPEVVDLFKQLVEAEGTDDAINIFNEIKRDYMKPEIMKYRQELINAKVSEHQQMLPNAKVIKMRIRKIKKILGTE